MASPFRTGPVAAIFNEMPAAVRMAKPARGSEKESFAPGNKPRDAVIRYRWG